MSPRARAYAILTIVAVYLGAIAFEPRDSPIATSVVAAALPLAGILGWRLSGASVRDAASWAGPLVVWNVAILVFRPTELVSVVGLTAGALWLAAFFSWSPVVPWWYEHVLRKPEPDFPTEQ